MTATDVTTGALSALRIASTDGDAELARKHAPLIMLDTREPYPPLAMGYTVFRQGGQSASSKFQVRPEDGPAIEYAIWYDWDIQHMYDLEHVWVYLDNDGGVSRVEASRHGRRVLMITPEGPCGMRGSRPVVFAEAGKHAHWATAEEMRNEASAYLAAMCGPLAGIWGVHEGNMFCEAGRYTVTPEAHRIAKLKMKADAFSPSYRFDCTGEDAMALVPWSLLDAWIPHRVRRLMVENEKNVPHLSAIFFDCGDTIADEATEVKRPGTEVVVEAALIPGSADMLRRAKAAGHRLALVADGPRETFENILKPAGLWDLFDAHIISGDIGVLKPDAKMFGAACAALGLGEAERARIAMVGNNLSRDIKGANDFGLISIFFGWSRLRTHEPASPEETPDHTIYTPADLAPLINEIEEAMAKAAHPQQRQDLRGDAA